MKTTQALLMALCLLPINVAHADLKQDKKTCLQHLHTLYRAIIAYKEHNAKLPGHLSDLAPQYLAAGNLQCPAERPIDRRRANGKSASDGSYTYEMRSDPFQGLSDPLGKFPGSDLPGQPWGTYRHVNMYYRTFFGDRVPMVRCVHHNAPGVAPDETVVLSLTLEGQIYESGEDWEKTVPTIAVALKKAAQALQKGVGVFEAQWHVDGLENHAHDWMEVPHISDLRATMTPLADLLMKKAPQMRNPGSAYKLATRLYYGVRDYAAALKAVRKTQQTPEGQDQYTITLLSDILIRLGQTEQVIPLYQKILDEDPGNRFYQIRMAEAYAATGQRDKAAEWDRKANQIQQLVGKAAPDFSLPTPEGRIVTLRDALRGKKALLVNFWFVHCSGCQQEFPHLQEVYTRFKSKGLGVVAINIVDDRKMIREYQARKQWTVPLLMDQDGGTNHGVASRYQAHNFPANFLVDAEGKILWISVGYDIEGMDKALKQVGFK